MHERRQFPRFVVQFPITLFQEGIMLGDGVSDDLSAGGCAAESQAVVGKGDYVTLRLYLPDHPDPTTPVMVDLAAVRWTNQQKVGLEFITMPSGDQQRLRRYVETLHIHCP
ncbi:MAG: PilZ domain-containing protein [Nitrospirae bacterium]|jgi:c-di-GMP-binding flagellar brake protein YcgR|nr:PilZ domain-containing protein [Nitrospirota bacterium]